MRMAPLQHAQPHLKAAENVRCVFKPQQKLHLVADGCSRTQQSLIVAHRLARAAAHRKERQEHQQCRENEGNAHRQLDLTHWQLLKTV